MSKSQEKPTVCHDKDCPFNHTCAIYKSKILGSYKTYRTGMDCPFWEEKISDKTTKKD